MTSKSLPILRLFAVFFPLILILPAARSARADTAAETSPLARIKRIQLEQLKREVPERIEESRARLEMMERARSARGRFMRDDDEDREKVEREARRRSGRRDEDPRDARVRPSAEGRVLPRRTAAAPPNVRLNNLSGDDPDASQNEPSIAAWGNDVIAAWNDWPNANYAGSLQGYAYSTDGGVTFTDGGVPEAPEGTFWLSDPVVTVNEKTGEFYYCALFDDPNPETGQITNGIAVMRGVFSGASLIWDRPRIAVETTTQTNIIDKPWMVADSLSGNLYLSYTLFVGACATCPDSIVFHRSVDKGGTWSRVRLNSPASSGLVHGSRVAVGPGGEVYATWFEQGPSQLPGSDFFRIRKSTNQGASFGPENTVASFFSNFGTGAPGYNRDHGVSFPSIAVDRSEESTRGRVYVSWNEALDWYDDVASATFGGSGTRPELENNDQLRLGSSPFIPGETLIGAFRDTVGFGTNDIDFWSFPAVQGTTYAFWADSVPRSLYTMRVVCADSLARLAFSGHQDPPLDAHNESIIVWTAPETGTYFLRMFYIDDVPSRVGSYHIRTGVVVGSPGDRGRDQRDVFVAGSDDGVTFDPPVRVNDDPPFYDNWLPEVAATSDGGVLSMWYDWRNGPPQICASVSDIHMARSDDGGAVWSPLGRMTTQWTVWTFVESNLVPNQGDYIGLYVNDQAAYIAWTDGRVLPDLTGGSSDIFGAVIPLLSDSLRVRVSGSASPEAVTLTWRFEVPRVVDVQIFRRQGSTEVLLATAQTGADGVLTYVDADVDRGLRYTYRLVVDLNTQDHSLGRYSIVVPVPEVLLHHPQPNPIRDRTYFVYEIPGAGGDVVIEVFDITGRRVRTLIDEHATPGLHDAAWNVLDDRGNRVKAGVYLIRLSFAGTRVFHRVSVVP
jgi:hypothetical protein